MTCQNVESQSLADSVISMQWTIEQMRVEKPHESGEWWHIARNINTTGAHWQKNAAAEYRSEGSNLVELLFNCLWLSAVRYKRRVSKWLPKEMTMTTCAKFSTSQSINQSTYQAGAKTEKNSSSKAPYTSWNKNLAIANRSRVSCAHNTSRASIGLITHDLEIWVNGHSRSLETEPLG